jgi:glycosyltransferase involved in cell wall biosynthesis
MAKVSIILPSYNHVKFLEDRLNSIVNQTFKDWKLIIIDDCSTDGSIEILKKFQKKHKDKIEKFIINANNSGSGYTSWEKGINLAKSEYIWIAETDDYSDDSFLEEMVKTLDENKNVVLTFCTSIYVNANKKKLYNSKNRTKDLKVNSTYGIINGSVYIDKMPFNTYITNGSAVVFRKPKNEVPQELFIYKQCSDIFFWTYLLKDSSFIFLNKELNYFRRHDDSTSEKISINKKKSVYFEKASFLNYYQQQSKYMVFINHYIKFYMNLNRKNILDIEPILEIKEIKFLKFHYFTGLMKFFFNKI